MAKDRKSKAGWVARRDERKREKRRKKILEGRNKRRARTPEEPGMGFWIGWGGF